MSYSSHSGEPHRWESSTWHESKECAGVHFRVARPSLMRRAELTRRVRDLVEQAACHAAGESVQEKLNSAVLSLEADRIYIDWGLLAIEGLEIDGEAATVRSLIAQGPERLSREIAQKIREESTLSEDERKN